jgi:hypothetical protein
VPLAPARSLDETFETTSVGKAAIDAVSVEEAGTRARVTNKAASNGTRSLELSRTKDSKAREWVPYVSYDPRVTSGFVQASFALRVEPGSVAEHVWRDEQLPYHVGPKLHVSPDGTLEVGGKSVAAVPLGKWFRVTIEMKLGENADGTWDLGLELPGTKTPTWMRGLSCDVGFQALRWFAFSAHGPEASTVYVDDIKLQPRP